MFSLIMIYNNFIAGVYIYSELSSFLIRGLYSHDVILVSVALRNVASMTRIRIIAERLSARLMIAH